MKTSTVLASCLFGALAIAAPVNQRRGATKTEIVWTTVYQYVTVADGAVPAGPTSSQGLFYERPQSSSSVVSTSTSAAAPSSSSSASAQSSSAAVTPVQAVVQPIVPVSSSPPSSSSVAPPPPPPASSSVAAAIVVPAPVAPAAAASSPPAVVKPSTSTGQQYGGADLTVYDGEGGKGACGQDLHDNEVFFALSSGTFGDTTFDRMTGKANNYWCQSKTITVTYNGKSVTGPVYDRCGGCKGKTDVDASREAWRLLGLSGNERYHDATWTLSNA